MSRFNITRNNPFISTYSIIARDEETGNFGIAAQSHWFAVGTVMPWVKAGVGVIAVQSFVNLLYAIKGLEYLGEGHNPKEIMKKLLGKDMVPEIRQITIMDKNGNIEAYTGNRCIKEAGHIIGKNFSVQGNLMTKGVTLELMAEAFDITKGGLAAKMIASLKAADKTDGDIRGRQSACMKIVRKEIPKNEWEGTLVDIRVDDHKDPIGELERLLRINNAYQHMNMAEIAFGNHDMETAFKEYAEAQNLYPENLEMSFWQAVSLANIGKYHEAYGIFYILFDKEPKWKIVTKRLISAEILNTDIEFMEKLFQDNPEIIDELLEENYNRLNGREYEDDI